MKVYIVPCTKTGLFYCKGCSCYTECGVRSRVKEIVQHELTISVKEYEYLKNECESYC